MRSPIGIVGGGGSGGLKPWTRMAQNLGAHALVGRCRWCGRMLGRCSHISARAHDTNTDLDTFTRWAGRSPDGQAWAFRLGAMIACPPQSSAGPFGGPCARWLRRVVERRSRILKRRPCVCVCADERGSLHRLCGHRMLALPLGSGSSWGRLHARARARALLGRQLPRCQRCSAERRPTPPRPCRCHGGVSRPPPLSPGLVQSSTRSDWRSRTHRQCTHFALNARFG